MKTTFRKAIAMIELIFAIVVMGLVLSTAPILLTQATESSIVTFQQESIAITAAHTNALMTYAWDENNTLSAPTYTTSILNVTDPTADTELNATNRLNPGSRQFNVGLASTTLGRDNTIAAVDIMDDVDDFIEVNQTLQQVTTGISPEDGDYIDNRVVLVTGVVYGNDNLPYFNGAAGTPVQYNDPFNRPTPVSSTNIKLINVTLTSTSVSSDLNSKNISMRAFMCNIGAANPLVSRGTAFTAAPGGLF